ncbi:MAG: hypothetical protein V2A34_10300 [Lentisphaerota bacterium]
MKNSYNLAPVKTSSELHQKKSPSLLLYSLLMMGSLFASMLAQAQNVQNGFELRWPLPPSGVISVEFVGSNPNPELCSFNDSQSPFTPPVYRPNTIGDPSLSKTGTPSDRKIMYRKVYPGIDLVCYGFDGRLTYDFMIAPWADPSVIRIRYDQAGSKDVSGSVPAYQLIDGVKISVQVLLQKQSDETYAYQIGRYDKKCDLVISSLAPSMQLARK